MDSKLLARMMRIGFTEYEARAYLALLQNHPASGYELSQASGVPSSKIYEVLSRLVDRQIVFVMDGATAGGRGKRTRKFIPADPEEVFTAYWRRIETDIDSLKDAVRHIAPKDDVSYIFNLQGREPILRKTAALIRNAEATVILSAWPQEIETLEPELRELADKDNGIDLALVSHGRPREEFGQVYVHPSRGTIWEERGGRGLGLVIDSRVALTAWLDGGTCEGAYSTHRAFVTMAEDYLRHEIYFTRITEDLDAPLIGTYGRGYEQLRDIYQGRKA